MRSSLKRLVPAALAIGALNALVFLGFEWIVHHGTDYIWNDLFDTDTERWAVVPVAIGLSLLFSIVVRAVGERRVVAPHADLLPGTEEPEPTSLSAIGVMLVIGATGLLAGASLGPEAPLVAAAAALGAWVAGRAGAQTAGKLLALSSVGALLVAFFGSLLPLAIPLLLLYRQEKKLLPAHVLPPTLACLAAFATLYAIEGRAEGWGGIPAGTDFETHDFAVAVGMGLLGALLAALLKRVIKALAGLDKRIETRWPWTIAAVLFGAVLGGLYLVGGQAVQFSGSEGSVLLLREHADAGALTLAGIAAMKLLATAWSVTCGYRGGLVFPAVFLGVAMSLALADVASGLAGPGAMIGSIAGILTAMTSPAIAVVMLLALLPLELIGVGLAGAVGAVLGAKALARFEPAE